MINLIIKFLNLLFAGMVAGTVFGIFIGFNPKNFSPETYIEQQQGAIRALNTLMPLLGLITIILTVISAILQRQNQTIFVLLLCAAAFTIISGLITRFGNQPINSIVMTWNKAAMPGNWSELRDKWWSLHIMRTLTSLIAFCLIIWSCLQKS